MLPSDKSTKMEIKDKGPDCDFCLQQHKALYLYYKETVMSGHVITTHLVTNLITHIGPDPMPTKAKGILSIDFNGCWIGAMVPP